MRASTPEFEALVREKLAKRIENKPDTTPAIRPSPSRISRLTLGQYTEMLKFINLDDREKWLGAGIIGGREFNQSDDAWAAYEAAAARAPKFADDPVGNLQRMREAFYKRSQEKPPAGGEELTVGSFYTWAREGGYTGNARGSSVDDFVYLHSSSKYLYLPSGQQWSAESVNAAVPPQEVGFNEDGRPIRMPAAKYIARYRACESAAWDAALQRIADDVVAREQGIVSKTGARLLNLYYPPNIKLGDPRAAAPWIDHVYRIIPFKPEAHHFILWLAHRVQRPGEKPRHAIVIGGEQGIGKDTAIDAVEPAIGAWNCKSITPDQIFSPFNEYRVSIICRINEASDLHDVSRYKFYEATKNFIAGSPDGVEVNPKYGIKFYVRNCTGVIITTNHIDAGLFLPPDDRRHFVIETAGLETLGQTPADRARYFQKLWGWLLNGNGFAHVAAYLHSVDLSEFDPNAPPPKTDAFNKVVANAQEGNAWLMDALDKIAAHPTREILDAEKHWALMVRGDELRKELETSGLTMQEISSRLNAAMSAMGYETYRSDARDGRHRLKDRAGNLKRVVVYVQRGLAAAGRRALLAKLES